MMAQHNQADTRSPEASAVASPASRAYPTHYTWRFVATDGCEFTIRPIRPEDEPMMVDFHKELSDRSVIHRYFSPVPLRTRTSHERLISKCSIDYYNEMALVAEHLDCTGKAGIAGVARMIREDTGNRAEVAFLVADRFQRRGLGRFLVDRTIEIAKKAGLASIEGILLFENAEMRKLFQSVGFKFGEPELSVYSAKLMLNQVQ